MTPSAQTTAEALSIRQARAELSRIIELPDPAAVALINTFGPVTAYQLINEGTKTFRTGPDAPEDVIARLHARLPASRLNLEALAVEGIGVLTPEDSGWPETLDDWDDAPVALWYRSDEFTTNPLDRLPDFTKTIAVTGPRAMSDYGAQVTNDVIAPLIDDGHTLITGTGYGIDAAALRAALGAANPRKTTRALAVAAGALDSLYPMGNAALLHQVAASGLLLSEHAPDTTPTRRRFIRRNVLLAHLADSLLIPEGHRRSAVRFAADAALGLGKPVAVTPGSIYSITSELPNALASDPGVTAVSSAAEIGQMLAYH
ncbi:DNA-processing protein DprA [Micrococcaceae sp. AOP34-BR2-30]